MASPQLEDGHTRLANELYDAILKFPFTKVQLKTMLAVVRKTYGYNKKSDDMTVSQIAMMTAIDRANISRSLGELEAMRCVLKQHGRHGYVIEINKNYEEWSPCQNNTPVLKQHGKRVNSTRSPCQNNTHKRQPQKTTPKDTLILARFEEFYAEYPRHVGKSQAETTFKKINPDESLFNEIMSGLRRLKEGGGFSPDPKYRPHPSSWLTGKRWLDEIEDGESRFSPDGFPMRLEDALG